MVFITSKDKDKAALAVREGIIIQLEILRK